MVILFSILFAFLHAEGHFRTICEKQKIYIGEPVTCEYIFVSEDEFLDIEVAKFPEYKGFWSENLALRQGPMMLPLISAMERGVVVGSYRIAPMMGRSTHDIAPMKVMVRSVRASARNSISVESSPPILEIMPLPKFPKPDIEKYFTGGVGDFRIQPESEKVPYIRGEPTTLRVLVTGQGNFSDFVLPLKEVTPGMSLLSEKNYFYRSNNDSSKIFEFSLLLEGEREHELTLPTWVTFDPNLKKYIEHPIKNTIRFVMEQKEMGSWLNENQPPLIIKEYSFYVPWERKGWFWLWQVPFVLAMIGILGRRGYRRWERNYHASEGYQKREEIKAVTEAMQRQDWERVIILAYSFAQKYCEPESEVRKHIFTARNELFYSPEKRFDKKSIESLASTLAPIG